MNFCAHPTLISIFLTISYHSFPLKVSALLILHLLAEHADQGTLSEGQRDRVREGERMMVRISIPQC